MPYADQSFPLPAPDHGEQSYVGSGRLAGRRALVTGGGSAIGRAVAIAFAREGADVALAYLPAKQAYAEQTADLVRAAGRRVALLHGDFADEATARALPQRAVDHLGALDILVNIAAVQTSGRPGIDDLSSAEMDLAVRTDLYALLWVTQAAVAHLPRGSAIINSSPVQAFEHWPAPYDHAATTAAVVTVTVNLAAELGPRGIRVNAVAPGAILTRQQQPGPERLDGTTPMGRAGQPAEVAPAFVFLASQRDASYISGAVLGVTGGRPVV